MNVASSSSAASSSALASHNMEAELNARQLSLLKKIPINYEEGTRGGFFGRNGSLCWIYNRNYLQILDTETGRALSSFTFGQQINACTEFAVRNKYYLFAASGSQISVIEVESGRISHVISCHPSGEIRQLLQTPQSDNLAETNASLLILFSNNVLAQAAIETDHLYQNESVIVLEAQEQQEERSIHSAKILFSGGKNVTCIAFMPKLQRAIIGFNDGEIRILPASDTEEQAATLKLHIGSPVTHILPLNARDNLSQVSYLWAGQSTLNALSSVTFVRLAEGKNELEAIDAITLQKASKSQEAEAKSTKTTRISILFNLGTNTAIVWETNRKGSRPIIHFDVFNFQKWFKTQGSAVSQFVEEYPLLNISTAHKVLSGYVLPSSYLSDMSSNKQGFFEINLLTQSAVFNLQFASTLSKVLQDIAARGPYALDGNERQELHERCEHLNLIKGESGVNEKKAVLERLLTLLHANDMTPIITDFVNAVKETEMGDVVYLLYSPAPVFDWVKKTKDIIEKHVKSMLDPIILQSGKIERAISGSEREELRQKLSDSAHLLQSLRYVVEALISRPNDNPTKLTDLSNEIAKQIEFIRVSESFLEISLLPAAGNYLNMSTLAGLWKTRRQEIAAIADKASSIGLTNGSIKPFIDMLFEEYFSKSGSINKVQYPPQNIQQLLEIFKDGKGDVESLIYRHLIIFYFLVDIQQLLVPSEVSAITHYARKFRITVEWQHLIYGLWLLDTQYNNISNMEQCVRYLGTSAPNLPPSWKDSILSTLLVTGAERVAKRLMNATGFHAPETKLKVLLANGNISEALSAIRNLEAGERRKQMELILNVLSSSKNLQALFSLNLDSTECKILEEYLVQTKRENILYYFNLMRSNYKQAVRIGERLPQPQQYLGNAKKMLLEDTVTSTTPAKRHPLFEMTMQQAGTFRSTDSLKSKAPPVSSLPTIQRVLKRNTTKQSVVSSPPLLSAAANFRRHVTKKTFALEDYSLPSSGSQSEPGAITKVTPEKQQMQEEEEEENDESDEEEVSPRIRGRMYDDEEEEEENGEVVEIEEVEDDEMNKDDE